MTPASMARFIKALYREAGISGASSHSGRRTLITRLADFVPSGETTLILIRPDPWTNETSRSPELWQAAFLERPSRALLDPEEMPQRVIPSRASPALACQIAPATPLSHPGAFCRGR
jgi:hypothetical protein